MLKTAVNERYSPSSFYNISQVASFKLPFNCVVSLPGYILIPWSLAIYK